jgi:hypothetical protein
MILSREEQREYAMLKWRVAEAHEAGVSALKWTVHLNEVQTQRLQTLLGVELRDYPAEKRRKLAKENKALPNGSFPIVDCADAEDAIRSVGRAKPEDRDKVRSHIRRRVRTLRCSGSLFDDWK